MALNLGELTIALSLDNDRLRADMAASKKELEGLPPVAQREMARVSRVFEDEGRKSGGKLAQGINQGLIRNSPLIVAGVGAALAAGAPLMMTAATALFGGVGIVAAAQSKQVQAAWVGTWNQIKAGAIADARVIEPVLSNMAGMIGASFERMRPLIRDGFAAAAPQIKVFTEGILDLGENAMPGLVRAVEAGMPVTQGFADFLAKTGTGLSDFFDRITAHGPAAGAVWSSLGDSMANLLPLLGELLGQGAELAANVLPLLSSTLGMVLSVATKLGPALPAIVAGFTAMKIVSSLSGPLGSFSTSLGNLASKNLPGISTAAGGASTAIGRFGSALPGIGLAVGAVATGMQMASATTDKWAQALLKGGAAARKAQEEAAAKSQDDFVVIGQWLGLVDTWEDVQKEAAEVVAAMSPLEQAQYRVDKATTLLNEKIAEFGPNSNEAEGAARALKSAQGELEQQNADLEMAISGVTQAMIDQANQAMGAIDADFAYQNSLDQLEDKQRALADAIRDHGRASEEADDAQRAYAEGIWETAQNAAKAAPELDGLKEGTKEYDRAVQNLTLKSLVDMRAGLGPEMQATVDGMIAKLQAGGASLDELGDKKPKPVVDADTDPLKIKAADAQFALDIINGKRPMPIAGMDPRPFLGENSRITGMLDALGLQRRDPTVGVTDWATAPLRGIRGWLDGLYDKTVTVTTIHKSVTQAATAVAAALPQILRATGGPIIGFDSGGAVRGPGGPTDDLVRATGPNPAVDYRLSNGEHIWTAREVAAAGGQAAVADIRKAALSGAFAGGGGTAGGSSPASVAPPSSRAARTVNLYTPDIPAALRALRADEQQQAALAPAW